MLVVFPVLCGSHTSVLRSLGGKIAANWLTEILCGSLPVNHEASDYREACRQLQRL